MGDPLEAVANVERKREELEASITKLRNSLQHWQTWEAEYEELKGEISDHRESGQKSELDSAADDFQGMLLNHGEVQNLLHDPQGKRRPRQQILGLLSRRLDYVRENVKAAGKRLELAEDSLAAPAASETAEGALPVKEILEQLDEDGKVVSSELSTPGKAAPEILEALRKGGLAKGAKEEGAANAADSVNGKAKSPSMRTDGNSQPRSLSRPTADPSEAQKGKAHAAESDTLAAGSKLLSQDKSSVAKPGEIATDADASTVSGLNTAKYPVPADETPKEAQIRREMLEYSMNEVGAIVAEIDLEEGAQSDVSDFEYENVSEEGEEDESSEAEDQYGRATGKVIDDEYRARMLELERKLNAKALVNAGPQGATQGLTEEHKPATTKEPKLEKRKSSKGVRFADKLDVQEAPKQTPSVARGENDRPVASSIVERAPPRQGNAAQPKLVAATSLPNSESRIQAPAERGAVSKAHLASAVADGPLAGISSATLVPPGQYRDSPFMTTQKVKEKDVPRKPPRVLEGKTHGDVTERPMQQSQQVDEPDEFDPSLMRREIANDYNRAVNRAIQRKGGFTEALDEEGIPVDQTGKKMSRFKAARMSQPAL